MNCRDSESLLLAERDGVLTDDQRAALSDHVAACPACAQLRASLSTALAAYKTDLTTIPVPDVDEAWRDLRAKLHEAVDKSSRKRPLAPVIWFGASLAAAAAIAFAVFVSRPVTPAPLPGLANTPPPPLHDPSVIAGADYVEAGDPDASVMVYVDKDSGWLVVWVADSAPQTAG